MQVLERAWDPLTGAYMCKGFYDSRAGLRQRPCVVGSRPPPLPQVAGHLRWPHQPLPDPRAPRVLATNGSLFFFLPRKEKRVEEGRDRGWPAPQNLVQS